MPEGLHWTLVGEGRRIIIYERDPKTNFLAEKHTLEFKDPLTKEEALKFIQANFPEYETEYPAALAD